LTLLVVGDIVTMDPARPRVGAVGVRNGRIAALGEPREVRRQLPDGAAELTVPGTAVPGFVDSHVHLMWAGRRAGRLALGDATSIGDIQDRIRRFVDQHPDQTWIEADAGFDAGDLVERRLPLAADLDVASRGRALLLDRKGHDALVNTAALRLAGISGTTVDPPGGRIDRDGQGNPTGLLVEQPAVAMVRAVLPEPTERTRLGWIEAGQAELLAHGLCTAVDPAVRVPDLAAYLAAERAGILQLRTVVMPWADDAITDAELDRAVTSSGLDRANPDWLRRGPTKLFLDGGGSLGTALRSRPWPGTDGYRGNQTVTTETLQAHCAAAAAAGRGVGVHAVGDAAIDLVLAVLTEVDRRTPIADLGFHLIHAYLHPSATAMATARRLGVGVSSHPALQWDFGLNLIDLLGEAEAAAANPLRDWLDAGVRVGGGSDGPGPPMSVLFGMWQARTRRIRGRDDPLGPGQAITAEESLALFTTGAARIAGGPGRGRLAVGQPADLALLNVDPLVAHADALLDGRVVATVVGGVVHEHSERLETSTWD
jgi:predicted amidohydrolase YtcJ